MNTQTNFHSATAGKAALFECRHITKQFRIGGSLLRVLDGVNCVIPNGAITLISGRTGQGKSTLLGLLAGLDSPTGGQILFKGTQLPASDVGKMAEWRCGRVGVIFQHSNLLPSWTALQNVEAALMARTLSARQRNEQALEWLDRVKLADRADHLPMQLSAGQQQLTALARAMAGRPEVILADEPTGDVDPETSENILECLTRFVRSGQGSSVIASHGAYPAEKADCLLELKNGEVHLLT
jgi:putative ABC transport system ATP-binding protein